MDEILTQALKALEGGNFDTAINLYSQILSKENKVPNVLCLRGVAYRRAKLFDESLADFEKASALIPDNASVYSEIAVTLFHMNRLNESLVNMNKAQLLEPNNPYRYSSRAYIKDACGDLNGAISDYKKCIELDPDDAVAHNNLGMLEEKLGRIEKAKQHFEKADEISKNEDSPFFGKFNQEGEKVLDKASAQKEVENAIKEAKEKDAAKKKQEEEIKQLKDKSPSLGATMMNVFKSKTEFKAFIHFIKNGFKH